MRKIVATYIPRQTRRSIAIISFTNPKYIHQFSRALNHQSDLQPRLSPLLAFSRLRMASVLKRKATDLAAADAKKPKANGSITAFFGAPKASSTTSTTSSAAAPPSAKFDKDAWVAKLTDEQKALLQLEIDTLHESWLAHLKDEVLTEKFLSLKRFLQKEKQDGKQIFPPLEDVYSWYAPSTHFPPADRPPFPPSLS